MIARTITQNLITDCDNKKAVVVIGPRQVGKTTLIQKIVEGKKTLFLNGDDPQTRLQLVNANFQFLMQMVMDYETIVIDEAQRIENIGLTISYAYDETKITGTFFYRKPDNKITTSDIEVSRILL